VAIADRDACGLLATVLERVQAEVRQFGDLLTGRPHAEDSAGVLGALLAGEKVMGESAVASESTVAADHPLSVRALIPVLVRRIGRLLRAPKVSPS